jgi:streptogrisin B
MDPWVRRVGLALVLSVVATGGAAYPAQAAAMTWGQLDALRDSLIRMTPVGSSASIDTKTSRVKLALAGPPSATLAAALQEHRGRVDVKTGPRLKDLEALYAGQGVNGTRQPQWHCTTGPMASAGTKTYILMPGHCVRKGAYWERKNNRVGQRIDDWIYGPEGDYGLIEEKGVTFTPQAAVKTNLEVGYPSPGIIALAYEVAAAEVGQTLCKMGNTTKFTCGMVLEVDASVQMADFVMEGMIKTDICAESGDSGGPLMTEWHIGPNIYAYPVGIVSSGNDDCSAAEVVTYFQPLQEILDHYELALGPARP